MGACWKYAGDSRWCGLRIQHENISADIKFVAAAILGLQLKELADRFALRSDITAARTAVSVCAAEGPEQFDRVAEAVNLHAQQKPFGRVHRQRGQANDAISQRRIVNFIEH